MTPRRWRRRMRWISSSGAGGSLIPSDLRIRLPQVDGSGEMRCAGGVLVDTMHMLRGWRRNMQVNGIRPRTIEEHTWHAIRSPQLGVFRVRKLDVALAVE